jgi:hypothetical protein
MAPASGPTRAGTTPSAAPPADQAQPVSTAAPEVPTPPPPTPTAIGFSLDFDPSTGRMFLEAREPVSGFIIYQMPPKYVIKQFTATVGSIEPARGAQVNSAA